MSLLLTVPSWPRRLACLIYDLLLLLAIEFFLFLLPNAVLGALAHIVLPSIGLLLNVILVAALYFVWFWYKTGQTLPMRTWKIHITDLSGRRPTLHRLILRFIWAALTCGLLLGAGFLWALFDRDGQYLHDRLADTRLSNTT